MERRKVGNGKKKSKGITRRIENEKKNYRRTQTGEKQTEEESVTLSGTHATKRCYWVL